MMRCALSVAGSDSIGGAGIQADIKAMAALGVHAHTVITAITAQNTCSVKKILPVDTEMIEMQLNAILSDSDVKAAKTGMLYNSDIVETVTDVLEDAHFPFVVDPVLVAGVGDSLASDDLVKALKKHIIPICDIVTPNRYEAEALTGMRINNEDDARRACELLGKEGTTVYLKGGHMDSKNVVDTLYNGAEFIRFEYPRLERAGHGGGCTLSAYITANLANGLDAVNAIMRSREMIQESIANMYVIGKGDKVVNPVVRMMQDPLRNDMLNDVNSAADRLVRILPKDWISKAGLDICCAMPNASSVKDVASIENGISVSGGRIRKNGQAKFGISSELSKAVLMVMEHDREQRAAVNVMLDKDITSIIEEVGMTGIYVDTGKDPATATSNAIKKNGSVPDTVVFKSNGNRGAIVILGKDPKDILEKISSIL